MPLRTLRPPRPGAAAPHSSTPRPRLPSAPPRSPPPPHPRSSSPRRRRQENSQCSQPGARAGRARCQAEHAQLRSAASRHARRVPIAT
eukprot:5534277-Pleurochrysis_carterae.AAC.1